MSFSNSDTSNSNSSQLIGGEGSNLYEFIDKNNVHGLNLAIPEQARDIIKPWNDRESTDKYAESGVDDQMIIHVPFTQNVRIKSMLIKLGRGEVTPCHLQIYANHPNIVDFTDAESTKPQLNISLSEDEAGVIEYPLRVAAFSSINSLSLFFKDSVGGEISRIYFLGFRGEVRAPRKDASSKLEIPAANSADAPLVDRVREKMGGQQTTAR